jgi:hypothetical protein
MIGELDDLKPIDETWMFRALVFIARFPRNHDGVGPLWTEVAEYMNWRPHSFKTQYRMGKLQRRGVAWSDDVPRSTHLTEEGLAHLRTARRRKKEEAVT